MVQGDGEKDGWRGEAPAEGAVELQIVFSLDEAKMLRKLLVAWRREIRRVGVRAEPIEGRVCGLLEGALALAMLMPGDTVGEGWSASERPS